MGLARAEKVYGASPDFLALTRSLGAQHAEPRATEVLGVACEFARRLHAQWAHPKPSLRTPERVAQWGIKQLCELGHEELWVLGLSARQELVAAVCVGRGGLHSVVVCIPEVLRAALRAGVSQFVMVHNHPSGDPTPSRDDIALTRTVQASGALVGVDLIDHVVIAGVSFVSMMESGYLAAGEHAAGGLRGVTAHC